MKRFHVRNGAEKMGELGMNPGIIRAPYGSMFLSPVFCDALANTTGARLELYDTSGAEGAARAAGFGANIYDSLGDAFSSLESKGVYEPDAAKIEQYQKAYQAWKAVLAHRLSRFEA